MTISNMSIEWGARAGLIAPERQFAFLKNRPYAPRVQMGRGPRVLALPGYRFRRGLRRRGRVGRGRRSGRS